VAVIDVTGNLKGSSEPRCGEADNKKAGKIYVVQILGVEEEIRDTQVFAKAPGDHGKEDDPAQQ